MVGKIRTCNARAWVRGRDRGDADPVMVLVTVAVVGLVLAGITLAIVSAHRWQGTYNANASQQTSEDAARMAWMSDVGTSTAVRPAAKSGTTAATSVELDQVSTTAGWPASATCRASLWWLEPTTDSTGASVVNVHRDLTYFPTSSNGSCTGTAVAQGVRAVMVRNAAAGAKLTYINGNLRDLVYPNATNPGVEACTGVAQTNTAGLQACTALSTRKLAADSQRTLWEWADTEPKEVLLEMTTTQDGTGSGYGTQIGWRQGAGRRELTGNGSSVVVNSLLNPFAPAAPSSPPTLTTSPASSASALQDSTDPTTDSVSVTRTDTRDLDGFEYQCTQTLDGASQLVPATPGAMSTANPAAAQQVPGTTPGATYTCHQRGWVDAVTTSDPSSPGTPVGSKFTQGISPWSADATATRRPANTQPGGTPDGSWVSTWTWPASAGAMAYEVQYRWNSDPSWTSAPTVTAVAGQSTYTWTYSTALPPDSTLYVQVRAVNAGGHSQWKSAQLLHKFTTPAISIEAGAVGKSAYTASWTTPAGFNPAVNDFEVQYSYDGGPWSASLRQDTTSFTVYSVDAGHSASVQVRAIGANGGTSDWAAASTTRPVGAPDAPAVSVWPVDPNTMRSSASGSSCPDPNATLDWASWDSVSGWTGWGSSTTRDSWVPEGSSYQVAWKARCSENGLSAEGPETNPGDQYHPWTAPATPTLSNPTDGYSGSNITFSWTATGGYYEVVNSSWQLRGYTTGTSWTTSRESGQTCAYVRAARSQAAADAGAWSGWSAEQCGTTLVPPAPGGGVLYVQAFCGGGFIASPGWNSSASANYYDVLYTFYTGSIWVKDESVPVYGTDTSFSEGGGMPGSSYFNVRAHNSQGYSAWSASIYQTRVGGCQ